MATDYRSTYSDGRRTRPSLIPAALTAAVGAALIGGLVWGAGRVGGLESPLVLGEPASTSGVDNAEQVKQTREQTIQGTLRGAQ